MMLLLLLLMLLLLVLLMLLLLVLMLLLLVVVVLLLPLLSLMELQGIFLVHTISFVLLLTASAYLLVSLVSNNHFRQGFRSV